MAKTQYVAQPRPEAAGPADRLPRPDPRGAAVRRRGLRDAAAATCGRCRACTSQAGRRADRHRRGRERRRAVLTRADPGLCSPRDRRPGRRRADRRLHHRPHGPERRPHVRGPARRQRSAVALRLPRDVRRVPARRPAVTAVRDPRPDHGLLRPDLPGPPAGVVAGADRAGLRADLLGARGAPRRRDRGQRVVAADARLPPAAGAVRRDHRVRRGGARTRPRRPPDLVPAHDLQRVLAPRAAGEPARGPRGLAAVAGRDDHAHAPAVRARRPARPVGALGAVVRGGGGDPQLAARARVLPLAAARSLVGQRRRARSWTRPRSMRSAVASPWDVQADLTIRAGYIALRRIATYFRIDFDPHPRPMDATSIYRERFDGPSRCWRRPACRWSRTETRPGATSTAGA